MRNKQLWILGLSMMLALTAACSKGGGEKTASAGKPETQDGKTIVTLAVWDSSPFYKALEEKFEAKYPGIDLQVQAYKQEGEKWEPGEYEEYKKTTNTALMAGKGADIIEADSLPFGEYVDKKLLVDLQGYIDQDSGIAKDDLQNNVLEAVKIKGGLYALPGGYLIRAFIGDGKVIGDTKINDSNWNWDEFAETSKDLLAKAKQNGIDTRYALANDPPELILQEMFIDSYPSWVDEAGKKARFDTPEFIGMMDKVKQMYEEGIFTQEPADIGKQLFYSSTLSSPRDFIDVPYTFFSEPRLLSKPHSEGPAKTRIVPVSQFVIRESSPVKEDALKFISFLLSEEAQSMKERQGFSLLKSVNERALEELQKETDSGSYKLPDGNAVQVKGDEFAKFRDILNNGEQFAQLDSKVVFIVGEEMAFYFSGEKSAGEAAKLIQNRVTTYLNE